jgi:methionine aminopeptidase
MSVRLPTGFAEAAATELQNNSIDGWLLFDLEGRNPVMCELLGLGDGPSRRVFLLLRPGREPAAIAHRIELDPWSDWEGTLETYVGWEELEATLGRLLNGCRTVAMEVSPGDAVPFVDLVPAGVVELVEGLGVDVVTSAPLIAGTYAQWGDRGYETHMEAGRQIASIAHAAFLRGLEAAQAGSGMTEFDLAEWILSEIAASGLEEGGTIVGLGPNSASGHYEPIEGESAVLEEEEVLLIDLWGKVAGDPDSVFADQTWMGVLGAEGPAGLREVWEAARAARDGSVAHVRERVAAGDPITGAEVDLVSRRIMEEAGFGEYLQHRLGHGMDRAIHGFGPNLDSVETKENRELIEGIGFSVEPGIYLPGRFGVRTEINVYMRSDGPEVTTPDVQMEPWRA